MKPVNVIVGCLGMVLLAACSEADIYTPLPPDKTRYAGEWKSENISLLIEPKGRVVYHKQDGSHSTNIDSPIKEFKGDNLVVGMAFVTTEFVVSEPPHEERGVWKMTVDGVELVRSPTTTY
jgi:hypothetical protein